MGIKTKSVWIVAGLYLSGCSSVLGTAPSSSGAGGNSSSSVSGLSYTTITPMTATLVWPPAPSSGNSGASASKYKVVRASSSDAIATIAGAEAATIVQDWGPALTATASFLASGTNYYFAVLARDGAGVETLYSPTLVMTPKIAAAHVQALSGGNWLLAYADLNNDNKGMAVVYDASGGVAVSPFAFAAGGVATTGGSDLGVGALDASSVAITYQSLADGFGHAALVKSDGTVANDQVFINDLLVNNAHGVAAGSAGQYFALTAEQNFPSSNAQGAAYAVLRSDGTVSQINTGVNNGGSGNETHAVCASSVGTNEALFIYTLGDAPYFKLVDDSGANITTPLVFNTPKADAFACAKLFNGSAVTSYRDINDENSLKLTSYQADGTQVSAPVTFATNGVSSAITAFSVNALVAFQNLAGTQYALYGPSGAVVQAARPLAAAFAPIDVQALNATQAVVLGRDANGNYGVLIFAP